MSIQKARKKPVDIEYVVFDGTNAEEIGHFVGLQAQLAGREGRLVINTLEGQMTVSPGDHVIKGVKGEFYPCKPDIFAETYDRLNHEIGPMNEAALIQGCCDVFNK